MSRFALVSGCSILGLLVSGLVACSEEKSKTDVYNPASPAVQRGSERLSLKDWEETSDKSLDLQDKIDFTGAGATSLEITSRCTFGKDSFRNDLTVSNPKSFYIFQLVPEEFLVRNLSSRDGNCAFDLKVFNGTGSSHIFPRMSSIIVDSSAGAVIVDLNNKIRFDAASGSTAEVLCTDMRVRPTSFDGAEDFGDLQIETPEIRIGHAPSALIERPIQKCRILVKKDKMLAQIGSIFEHKVPTKALIVTPIFRKLSGTEPGADHVASFNDLFLPEQLTLLGEFRIENPEPGPRRIEIPKQRMDSVLKLFRRIKGIDNLNLKHQIRFEGEFTHFTVAADPTSSTEFTENENSWVIKVGPNASFTVSVFVKSLASNPCFQVEPFEGALILELSSISVREQYETGELVSKLELVTDSEFEFGTSKSEMAGSIEESFGQCVW